MKIIKALNNNMVLARTDRGQEVICQGKGIGFGRRPGDLLEETAVERTFVPETAAESSRWQQLFSDIPEDIILLGEKVLSAARTRYKLKVKDKVLLPVCDHMAGILDRYRKGIRLTNPTLWDVKRIYQKEYKVGRYAVSLMEETYGLEILDDEAAFLAWHFVFDQQDQGDTEYIDRLTDMVSTILQIVEESFQIELNEEDWNYQRFMTHLKFFVNRILTRAAYEDDGNDELYEEMKARYPHVYKCVERIADYITIDYHYDPGIDERLYLMIHLERVSRKALRTRELHRLMEAEEDSGV